MDAPDDPVSRHREAIDRLDRDLVRLLAERLQAARGIGDHRSRDQEAALRDEARERRLFEAWGREAERLGISAYFAGRVLREILNWSRRDQERFLGAEGPARGEARTARVGYQGVPACYSDLAIGKMFSTREVTRLDRIGFRGFAAVLDALESGSIDYALLPIENTTSGSVHDAYDALSHTDLAIVGEEVLRIEMCLVGIADVPLESLRKVYSHPQALSQCTAFLASLPQCTVETFIDTAMSVERVKREADPTHVAIASAEAAALHGLHILRRDIANHRENFTRFLVIARESEPRDPRVPCKTSVMFVTAHERGALLACLNVIAAHGLNLTKLESRPRPGRPFEYLFYVEFEGNAADAPVQRALDEISALTKSLKIFGSFPARTATAG